MPSPEERAKLCAWLETLVPAAQRAAKEWPGMRVAVSLAQAALETGWGKRVIGGFNFWGIKRLKWVEGFVKVKTHEWEPDLKDYVARESEFAAFPDMNAGFACYGRLVTNSPSYADARQAPDLEEYVARLAKVWATDPMYRKKVWTIIQMCNLARLDNV